MGRMDERTFRGRLNEQVVRCTCQAGTDYKPRQRRGREPVELPVFREGMVEVDRTRKIRERVEDLIAWAKSWKPTNYVRAFDDF